MTTLRNIWADLVEKRLWPVALALLVAIVAVPVILAKKPEPQQAAELAAATSVQKTPDGETVVALDTSQTDITIHAGDNRNPFKQLFVPKQKSTSSDTATQASGGGGDTTTDTGSSGGSGDSKTDSSSGGGDTPAGETLTTYRVTLRFGQAGSMKTLQNVARLTPLPSATNPFFVFLGVKTGGDTLVFLVSSDAKGTGDGTCKPSKSTCETIELHVGDTEFFDLNTETGTEQYQMDIVSIHKLTATSSAAASRARARQSREGRALLEMAAEDGAIPDQLGAYRWDAARGVLTETPAG